MFLGSKEVQQASTQQILEAKVHLERAEQALASITPAVSDQQQKVDVIQLRSLIRNKAIYLDNLYNIAFEESYK